MNSSYSDSFRKMEITTGTIINVTLTTDGLSKATSNSTGTAVITTERMPIYATSFEKIIFYCALYPTIIIAGIAGNAMTLLILHQLKEKTSSAQFLFSLAVSDTMTLLIRFIYMVYNWGLLLTILVRSDWTTLEFLLIDLFMVTQRISKMTIVGIVIERVFAVHLPFRVKSIITRSRVKLAIVFIYIIILVSSLPNKVYGIVLDQQTKPVMDSKQAPERNAVELTHSSLYRSRERDVIYAINRIVFDFLPVLLVACGNLAIIIRLKRNKDIDKSSQHSRLEKTRKLTRLLLSISFCYLVLCGPVDFFAFFVILGIVDILPDNLIIIEIFKVTSLLNCSINFIFYALMNQKFKEKYIENLCCTRCKDVEDVKSNTDDSTDIER